MYEQGEGPEYSNAAWEDIKDTLGLPFPSLPYFIDETDSEVRITDTLAILKYISARYAPRLSGSNVAERGTVEMFSHVLIELNRLATKPCYMPEADKQAIGDNILKNMAPIVEHFEAKNLTVLLGSDSALSYTDFLLFEVCERVEFLTEGRLLRQHPAL